ncbi:MAG: sugar O-acetyltransferase [Endomicrobiaceae bacterium]
MTEYEKMISGELYNAADEELSRMRANARILLAELNKSLCEIKSGERLILCGKIFGKTGKGLILQPPFYCDYGINIELGDNVSFNFNCVILDVAKVTIGSYSLFGPNVQIYTAGHPLESAERQIGLEFGKPVSIGSNVWVGGNAVICPGVSIGNGSIVGAGSVVTKDVPANVIAAGNPAKIIKKL